MALVTGLRLRMTIKEHTVISSASTWNAMVAGVIVMSCVMMFGIGLLPGQKCVAAIQMAVIKIFAKPIGSMNFQPSDISWS